MSSPPVTGFGQYELERFDSLDNEWQLIMSASSPTVRRIFELPYPCLRRARLLRPMDDRCGDDPSPGYHRLGQRRRSPDLHEQQ